MERRIQILVRGIVQGVGFRPYVFSLAQKAELRGQVHNNAAGVLIDVEGDGYAIARFLDQLQTYPPPLAHIDSLESTDLNPADYQDFRIVESDPAGERLVSISPDIATCADCLREMFNPDDRRYRYPFNNCTNCGPRFTIIKSVPYDRERTTMSEFEMCGECRAEYENPLDRRFHAEPTACPRCGPQLSFIISAGGRLDLATDRDPIASTRSLLLSGGIVAIKGLGGFHLACDGLNQEAVERLRRRKYREDKPFALMAASVDMVRTYCRVSPAEQRLLESPTRPIVLLRTSVPFPAITPGVAPGVRTLGFMLPYTPLHFLLFEELDRPLVMTSGNISDEPICYQDAEATNRLAGIADAFLMNNRAIHIRTDDSVMRVDNGREVILRRSRGFAPAPIRIVPRFKHQILSCGAELKNTFCLTKGDNAFLSHHIGDLENAETLQSFTDGIEHFKNLFNLCPEAVAYDLHPECLATKYALALDEPRIGVQHHHAHILSCLADNGALIEGEPVIGIAFDGLGYGEDGNLWGGEFLIVESERMERAAHLEYRPMPGASQAIREPWRMAAVFLQDAYGDDFTSLELPFLKRLDRHRWNVIRQMIASGLNCPQTSSMGRLFDAVSSLLGVRDTARYEGQAAIELESAAGDGTSEPGDHWEFEIEGSIIRTAPLIRSIVDDLLKKRATPVAAVAAKFHNSVAALILRMATGLRELHGIDRIALSGGVFQNGRLLESSVRLLEKARFTVFTHHRVPPNDGGISLGQAVFADAIMKRGSI